MVPAARTFEDFNPSDNSLYLRIADGSREDARRAIEAALAAFPAWSALPFHERAHAFLRIADVWERRAQDFVNAAVAEGGGWFGKGMFETGYVAEVFRSASALCYQSIGEGLPSEHHKFSIATRWPLGAVSVISPWNMPGILTARGFAAALAAGNTVMLKPSEETPYAGGLYFAEILEEAGIPACVFNVITCSRESVGKVGDEMIENPFVKAASFTGSTAVGRHIAAKASAHLKKACVELGGKDSMIVMEDADLDAAARAVNFGAFMDQGRICMSTEKLLVQESVYDEFMQKFLARAARLKTGHTGDRENVIGPLVIVVPFRTEEEAIALNNDTECGLTAAVSTRDEASALRMAGRLETGMVHVNCQSVNDEPHVPFGGVKDSGVGRYGGRRSLGAFTELRWIALDRDGWHFPPQF